MWDVSKPMPPQIHINVNINIMGLEEKSDVAAEAPFVFTVNFVPSIAQISVRGRAYITGDSAEIKKMMDESKAAKAASHSCSSSSFECVHGRSYSSI